MTRCNELMTSPVVTCEEQEPVINVARQMDSANVGSIPIVRDRGSNQLVGMLSDRDIVKRVVAKDLDANTTTAGSIMTSLVYACHPDDNIDKAKAKMAEYQIRRIPIVDDSNRVVGIIAQADIARHLDKASTGVVVSEISEEKTRHND